MDASRAGNAKKKVPVINVEPDDTPPDDVPQGNHDVGDSVTLHGLRPYKEEPSDSDDDEMSMVSASQSLPDLLEDHFPPPKPSRSRDRLELSSSRESFESAVEGLPETPGSKRRPSYNTPDYDLIVADPSVPEPPPPQPPESLLQKPQFKIPPPSMEQIPEEPSPSPPPPQPSRPAPTPSEPARRAPPPQPAPPPRQETPQGTDAKLKPTELERKPSKKGMKKRPSKKKKPLKKKAVTQTPAPSTQPPPPLEPEVTEMPGPDSPPSPVYQDQPSAPVTPIAPDISSEPSSLPEAPATPLRPLYGLPDYDTFKEVEVAHMENRTIIDAIHGVEKVIQDHCRVLARKQAKPAAAERPADQVPKTALRAEQVTVYVRVVFLKIGEIDTLKEQFNADAFIQARWREPFLDGRRDINPEEIDWDKYWNPKLYVENSLGEPKETVWQTLVLNREGEATVFERRRIKGSFLENLELNEFPFDTQDLTLTVSSERPETEVQLVEDSRQISSINVQSFVDEQEWRLHSHVETWRRVSERVYQSSRHRHPAISASCRASRRPGFFLYNIFLVMLSICSLAFTTFTVDLELPMNRLQLSFILLLTTITFKFVVSQSLPRIPYLTYLDKYILTSMAILCTVCIWHSVVPLWKNIEVLALTADKCALLVIWSTYLMFHICFFAYIYWGTQKKRWVYAEKDRLHKERMRQLQKQEELEAAKKHRHNTMGNPMTPSSMSASMSI